MENRVTALLEKENTCYKIADTALKDAIRDMRVLLTMNNDEYIAKHVVGTAQRIVEASADRQKASKLINVLDWIRTGELK